MKVNSSRLIEGVSLALARRLKGPDPAAPLIRVMQLAPAGLSAATGTFLNLLCYRTSINPFFTNDPPPDPTRSSLEPGPVPPLALDLHYCLTAHHIVDGDEEPQLRVQRELGRAMVALLADPVLGPDEVEQGLGVPDVHVRGAPPIRIEREDLGLADLNQIWSAFQSDYHLGLYFKATVALIVLTEPTPPAQPVLQRSVGATPATPPVPDPPIVAEGRTAAFPGEVVTLPASGVDPGAVVWFRVPADAWAGSPVELLGTLEPLTVDGNGVRFRLPGNGPMPLVPGIVEVGVARAPTPGDQGDDDLAGPGPGVPLRVAARVDAVVRVGPPGELLYVDPAIDPVTVSLDGEADGPGPADDGAIDRPDPDTDREAGEPGGSLLSGITLPGPTAAGAPPEPATGRSPTAAAGPGGGAGTDAGDHPTVRVDLTPPVLPGQPARLVLVPRGDTAPDGAVELSRVAGHDELRFPVEGIPAGRYVVRVRVAGVENMPAMTGGDPAFVEVDL